MQKQITVKKLQIKQLEQAAKNVYMAIQNVTCASQEEMDSFYNTNNLLRFFYVDQVTDLNNVDQPFKSFVNTANRVPINQNFTTLSNYLVRKYKIEG